MKENKKQFFFSDKPIDLSEIASNTEEPLEMPIDWEEATKPHTISFDCQVSSKETADFFKKHMEELESKEKEILGRYRHVARFNARYYLPILQSLASDEAKEELLEDIILKTLCKGWNDCFNINVKHEK